MSFSRNVFAAGVLRALLAISALVSAHEHASAAGCDQRPAEWVFCEDFEKGDLSAWDSDTRTLSEVRALLAEKGPSGVAGNHVFRLRVPAGRGGTGLNKTFTPSEYDVLYARWYIAYEAGFDFSARNHGHGLHAGDRWKKGVSGNRPAGNDWFTAQVDFEPSSGSSPPRSYIYSYYRGMKMDCSDPNGSCWGDHIPCMIASSYCNRAPALRVRTYPPPLEHERWYCIELMVDAGDAVASESAANGAMNLWVDGVEIGPWTNMWLRTSSSVRLNHFWLGLFHHDERHSVEGVKYDDVVVSTQRIGCGQAPVRPRPPTDLASR